MIQSAIGRGKIYAGDTQLACTIRIEQTGAMRLTVRAGTFTHTDSRTWELASDAVFDLATDPTHPTECQIEIGDIDGIADVWCATKRLDGIEEYDPPAGWNTGHPLVFQFVIPPGTTNLSGVDIFVLEVLPDFPKPELMAALGIKRGADGSIQQTGGL